MKISDYIYTGVANLYGKNNMNRKNNTASEFSRVLDTVEISSDGNSRLAENNDIRMDKVKSIKEKIISGSYIFDMSVTAGNMLFGSYLQ